MKLFRYIDKSNDKGKKIAMTTPVFMGSGVPGLVDFESGYIHTLTNVPGWKNIPFREILEQRLEIPIFIDNDANCMAYAEYRYGAAKGCANMVALTLGTGIVGSHVILMISEFIFLNA